MSFISKLLKCLFVWNVKATQLDGAEAPDVILAHGAGDHTADSPGHINVALGKEIRRLYGLYPGIAILAQGESAQCVRDLPSVITVAPRQRDRGNGPYIDTIAVIVAQKRICEERGLRRPILVTIQPHTLRAQLTTERMLGVKVAVADNLPKGYDPACSQFWWRYRAVTVPREILVRLLYLFTGKM